MPVVSVAAPASRGGPGQGRGGATLRSPQRRLAPRGGRSALLRRRPAFQRGIGLARRVIRSRRALADRPQRLAPRARAHRRGTVRQRRPCRHAGLCTPQSPLPAGDELWAGRAAPPPYPPVYLLLVSLLHLFLPLHLPQPPLTNP